MAEPGKTVMSTVEATGSRGRLTGNTLNHYSTSYTTSYGGEKLTPCLGRHHYGKGCSANFRPALYYRPSLDHVDNPRLGLLLLDSLTSQTKRHFQPHIGFDGSEAFPNLSDTPGESGYLQLRTRPETNMSLQTEYRRVFVPHHPSPPVSQNHLTVGRKGESGFTEGAALQLNTFQPKNSGMVEPRRTQNSVMRSDFLPPSFPQGTEALPSMVSHTSRETGFTRDTIAPLACPASLRPVPQIKNNAPTEMLIGKKECSGFVLNAPNNLTFPNTPSDCSRFLTNYQSKFRDHAVTKFRSGWPNAGISTKRSNGYTGRDMDRFIFTG